ncbi:MAG: DUF805 domain-containing protein [Lachnospiraceae bacterium]|nr:DUF805 domain-containing protein [Lachnospiraceae bacterium]
MMVKEFIGSCKNIFNFHGRARRREYWVTQLWLWSILLLDGILALVMQYIPEEGSEAAQIVWGIGMILAVIVFLVVLIALVIMSISLSIRRCHDIGMSGWIYLLCKIGSLCCGIGSIAWLVLCCFDSKDDNKWGPNPKKADANYSAGSIVLGIVVFVASIILFQVLVSVFHL